MAEFVEYTEPEWRGLNMRELKVDEAYIILTSHYEQSTTYLYSLSDECYTCPYTQVKVLQPRIAGTRTGELSAAEQTDKLNTIKLNVAHALKFKLFDSNFGRYAFDNETALCEVYDANLQEFGVYNFTVKANGSCEWTTDKQGFNGYLSLLSVFVLFGLLFAFVKIFACTWKFYRYDEQATVAVPAVDINASPTSNEAPTSGRCRMCSLDAFRGLAIVLMVFVNSGGGHYWWTEHIAWNGLQLADVLFPSFLWIMGVCIPISVKSQLRNGATKLQISRRIIWRSLKLFAIGVCLNSTNGPQMEKLRIMGVLQRFGVAYFFCGLVHTVFAKREHIMPQLYWKRSIYDLTLLKGEFFVTLVLLVTHLAIVFGLDVPDCPKGYFGPGGKHAYSAYTNCIGGATGYIDLQILGNNHVYQHPTAKYVYDSKAFDPEGVFGCLLTIVQVFFGLLAGVIALVHTTWRARITRWICWSLVLALIGGALCSFTREGGLIPMNKNLWSLSFVLVTSALSFCVLSVLYFTIDVQRWWSGSPFVESGMNAIVIYVGHTVMHKMLPWHWRVGAMNTHFALLLEATWNTLIWIIIALYFDSIKFYYSV